MLVDDDKSIVSFGDDEAVVYLQEFTSVLRIANCILRRSFILVSVSCVPSLFFVETTVGRYWFAVVE